MMTFGMIGSGSWGTALVKILTDAGHPVVWGVRTERMRQQLQRRGHNPNYLSSVSLRMEHITLTLDPLEVIKKSEVIVIATPSAYVLDSLNGLDGQLLEGKNVLSAVKGIIPQRNLLLNDHLSSQYGFPVSSYFTVMGPCHAEEVAAEKLSYLTFSGIDESASEQIASCFATPYINTVVNTDIYGVQYAAILKNIYALGAGIAHGQEYGDNFLSVLIANCAEEMAVFLRKAGIRNMEVGNHPAPSAPIRRRALTYAASVYLGDLLVTCYSLFSRNRTFGNMIGKGYSVQAAQLEMNMVAEGYNASRSIMEINKSIGAEIPIVETIHAILWEHLPACEGMKRIEEVLV
jgi:glycerol-3-phosphate dehydrogenase (NAD(P)+)